MLWSISCCEFLFFQCVCHFYRFKYFSPLFWALKWPHGFFWTFFSCWFLFYCLLHHVLAKNDRISVSSYLYVDNISDIFIFPRPEFGRGGIRSFNRVSGWVHMIWVKFFCLFTDLKPDMKIWFFALLTNGLIWLTNKLLSFHLYGPQDFITVLLIYMKKH